MKGYHALLATSERDSAAQAFLQAIARDPTNARAHAGMSSVWTSAATQLLAPFDEAMEQAELAANKALELDSLEGTAWLSLAVASAYKTRSMRVAEPFFGRAIEADPGNSEVQQVKSAMYRHAWAWEEARDQARLAYRLDPSRVRLIDREAIIYLCSNQAEKALDLYRSIIRLSPQAASAHLGAARALARLGRWDEAIAERRLGSQPTTSGDSALLDTLASGERGYWQLVQASGRKGLDQALANARTGYVSPMRIAQLRIAAGEIDAGLDALAKAAARPEVAAYLTVCVADWEQARSSPRFWQILESLPRWDLGRPAPRPR
jgi:predicted Zn-dependent protease